MKKNIVYLIIMLTFIFFLSFIIFNNVSYDNKYEVMSLNSHKKGNIEKKIYEVDVKKNSNSIANKNLDKKVDTINDPDSKNEWINNNIFSTINDEVISHYNRLEVIDVFNNEKYLWYVNFNSDNIVSTTGIYRDYKHDGEYHPAIINDVSQYKWDNYPIISHDRALNILNDKYTNKNFSTYNEELYSTNRSNICYYFYEKNNKNIGYFVNAETGDIETINFEEIITKNNNDDYEFLNKYTYIKDNILYLDRVAELELKKEDYLQLKDDVEKTNIEILKGNLLIDNNFNVIFDQR